MLPFVAFRKPPKLRRKIVPAPAERATEPPTDHAPAQGETPRMSWARLLKRVFDIDTNDRMAFSTRAIDLNTSEKSHRIE
jgi:hypothetical protein